MSFVISYQERARREYNDAIQWYRERSELAAINFQIAVNEKINVLRTHPKRYKKTYKQFREVAVKKYPYGIVYLIDEEKGQIIISSIFHHKRNPRIKY